MSEEGMDNHTAHDLDRAAVEQLVTPHVNGNGNGHGGPHLPEWVPPRTRDEADQAIIGLSNDIGLILAQLAEDQAAWCLRTGRAPSDYAAWRRRALFAKVHKEGQLRECKRVRTQLSANGVEADGGLSRGAPAELLAWCRLVVEAWLDGGTPVVEGRLGQALAGLAAYLDHVEAGGGHANGNGNGHHELNGSRVRPVAIEPGGGREPAARPTASEVAG